MHPNLSTNPTGNPFEKTMLMLEIEKRDLEIQQLKSMVDLQATSIKEMASVMQMHSSMFQSGMHITDEDWAEFDALFRKYGVFSLMPEDLFKNDLHQLLMPAMRNAMQEFLRFKLGKACVEKID